MYVCMYVCLCEFIYIWCVDIWCTYSVHVFLGYNHAYTWQTAGDILDSILDSSYLISFQEIIYQYLYQSISWSFLVLVGFRIPLNSFGETVLFFNVFFVFSILVGCFVSPLHRCTGEILVKTFGAWRSSARVSAASTSTRSTRHLSSVSFSVNLST